MIALLDTACKQPNYYLANIGSFILFPLKSLLFIFTTFRLGCSFTEIGHFTIKWIGFCSVTVIQYTLVHRAC